MTDRSGQDTGSPGPARREPRGREPEWREPRGREPEWREPRRPGEGRPARRRPSRRVRRRRAAALAVVAVLGLAAVIAGVWAVVPRDRAVIAPGAGPAPAGP